MSANRISPAAAGHADNAISPAGQAQLLEMSYSRILLSITVLPVITFCLAWFYAQKNDATGMALWFGFYVVFEQV